MLIPNANLNNPLVFAIKKIKYIISRIDGEKYSIVKRLYNDWNII